MYDFFIDASYCFDRLKVWISINEVFMYKRSLTPVLERFAKIYLIVGITGPHQSGKTTLAKQVFPQLPYVSLENLDTRLLAKDNPRGFLKQYAQGAIIDRIQHVPELLSYMQQIAGDSSQKGRFIIIGSQDFFLSENTLQSLSGCIGMTTLLPLSLAELGATDSYQDRIFRGGYPVLYGAGMTPTDFYPSYIQTYVERGVRQVKNIEQLGKFQLFLKLCAGRIGQLMNLSSLAQDCGISHTTARQWLTVLEASYIIFFLQPFYKNFNKRLVKIPKLYFYDTGLACSLLGLEKENQVEAHYLKGALYENMVVVELLKNRFNKALPVNLFFWRDQTGHEVDIIAEWGGSIKAIEVKSGSTFQPDFIKNVRYFTDLVATRHPEEKTKSYVIYGGGQQGVFSGTQLVPFLALDKIINEE